MRVPFRLPIVPYHERIFDRYVPIRRRPRRLPLYLATLPFKLPYHGFPNLFKSQYLRPRSEHLYRNVFGRVKVVSVRRPNVLGNRNLSKLFRLRWEHVRVDLRDARAFPNAFAFVFFVFFVFFLFVLGFSSDCQEKEEEREQKQKRYASNRLILL